MFLKFLQTYVSVAVIAGLFTYRLISSIINNLISPLISMMLHEQVFYSYNVDLGANNERVLTSPVDLRGVIKYRLGFGIILRELIIWVSVMFILYLIALYTQKK